MLNVPTIYEPVIQVCPRDHDFGEVQIGRFATASITIMDYDGCHLHVSDIRFGDFTDPAFSFPDLPFLPMVVPSESSTRLEVTFCPLSKGRVSGSVEIVCDDPGCPVACVALHGVGV
jgi:hypothetical protein